MTKAVKAANATRAKKVKAQQKAAEERKNAVKSVKAQYLNGDGEAIVEDLRSKITSWMALNNKIAQDGVGVRPTGFKLQDGSQEVENIYLTSEQRASYLDQSKGMQAILDYINRQMEVEDPSLKVKKGEQ